MTDILKRARLVRREIFDPTNPVHIESFKVFLATNNWGDVQFYPEAPFTEAPATVMTKYARHSLGVQEESAAARAARLLARNILPPAKPERARTPEENTAHLKYLNRNLPVSKQT